MPSRRAFLQSLIAAGFAAPANASINQAKPYLQSLSRNAATVVWGTLTPDAGQLELSGEGRAVEWITPVSRFLTPAETGLAQGLWLHEARISGLDPCGRYRYGAGTESEFFAHPVQAVRESSSLAIRGAETAEQRQLAARMATREPDLILHTGDLVYPEGDADGYLRKYLALYQDLFAAAPVFPCAGNHDYYHAGGRMFVEFNRVPRESVPPEGHGRYYSFDWESAHVTVLDSNTPLEDAAAGHGKMLTWLDQDLAASKSAWRIVMFHHPPYAGGPNQDDPLSALAREHIVPILERHRVDLALSGHEHNYQRTRPIKGVTYVTSGGGGASIYEPLLRAEALVQHGRHHYLEAELTSDTLRIDAVTAEGRILDTVTLQPARRADP